MSRLVRQLATVNTWKNTDYSSNPQTGALDVIFSSCGLFSDIWIPIREVDSDGMGEVVYTNIGYETDEIAEIYATYFGENYFVEAYTKGADPDFPYVEAANRMYRRVLSVIQINTGKYLKLIELMGYSYNPLFNVDGIEEYTYIENSGVNNIKTDKKYATYTDNTTDNNTRSGGQTTTGGKTETHEDTNQVTTFDSTDFKDTDHNNGSITTTGDTQTTTYNNINDNGSGSITHGAHTDTDEITITHHNAKNGESDYSGGTDQFGNVVVGGDKYHNERKLRQGNIGVTKTQELIAAERENLRFNIIMEFFKDLNEQVLVGIY